MIEHNTGVIASDFGRSKVCSVTGRADGARGRGATRGRIPTTTWAVFLKDLAGFGQEAAQLAEIETEIHYDAGAVINAMPLRAGSYQDRTGLMQELRREGHDL